MPTLGGGGPRARHGDHDTSIQAARSLPLGYLSDLQHHALQIIANEVLGATDYELACRLNMLPKRGSVVKRRTELVALGLVEEQTDGSGAICKRYTDSHRLANVWTVTRLGRALINEHHYRKQPA